MTTSLLLRHTFPITSVLPSSLDLDSDSDLDEEEPETEPETPQRPVTLARHRQQRSKATAQSGEVWGQCALCRDFFSIYVSRQPGGRVELAETPRLRWSHAHQGQGQDAPPHPFLVHTHPFSPTLPPGKVNLYGSLERFSDPRFPDPDPQLRRAVYPPAYR